MTVRRILAAPDPRLRMRPDHITQLDPERLERHFADLTDTMLAHHGVGLAANQIGVGLPLAVVLDMSSTRTKKGRRSPTWNVWRCVNLEVMDHWGVRTEVEGCLSVPGGEGMERRRPKWVMVRFLAPNGLPQLLEFEDRQAVVFQHEADHLRGRLFIDPDRRPSYGEGEDEHEARGEGTPPAGADGQGGSGPA